MSKNKYEQRRKKKQQQSPTKTSEPTRESPPEQKKNGLAILLITLVVIGVVVAYLTWPVPNEILVQRVQEYSEAQLHPLVIESVEELVERKYPVDVPTLITAAQSSVKMQEPDKAIEFLELVDDNQAEDSVIVRRFAFDILFDAGRAKEAEAQMRRALKLAPGDPSLNSRMAHLLNIVGRRYEAEYHLLNLLDAKTISWEELIQLANRYPTFVVGPAMKRFSERDVSAKLNDARLAVTTEQLEEGRSLLEEIADKDPENIEARLWLGRVLVAMNDLQGFASWYANLSEEAKQHPDYWYVLGMWAVDQEQNKAAMHCLWEHLRQDPENPDANYHLATLIKKEKILNAKISRLPPRLLQRRNSFFEFQTALDDLKNSVSAADESGEFDYEKDKSNLLLVARQLEDYGRLNESLAWYKKIASLSPEAQQDVKPHLTRLSTQVQNNTSIGSRYVAGSVPAGEIDLSTYPLPDIKTPSVTDTENNGSKFAISFVDEAPKAGIDVRFFSSGDEKNPSLYMHEVMGAGVGVVDFNVDGLPDIYAVQGCKWPVDLERQDHTDRLFENLGNGTFRDVTSQATIMANGFGQGVNVGDINSDGFPDLYVANVYGNNLLLNNGDGTYSDVTKQAQIQSDRWTVSSLIADLNGDLLPDLYDVNYAYGDEIFTRICGPKDKPRSCPPRDFPPDIDEIWINRGDGTFEKATNVEIPAGRGIGIVAGDINHNGKLDLFIGNDTDPNILLLNESEGGKLRMRDAAAEFGLDLDSTGVPQACMGIAVADFNQDQKIDYFVTNYWNESNTLYLSEEFGYADSSRRANLSSPGYYNVGWGTQFIDMELDGDPDLFITNGHVQNFWGERPFRQKPMLLINNGQGRFEEFEAGELTQNESLGRALAKLDWNRDGKQDLIATSLDQPMKLLTNHSRPKGSFISLRLIGTESSRDAIGTRVTVTQKGEQQHQQLTAGDGYAVSNQRELIFAASEDQIESIRITWPSGKTQVFKDILSGKHYILIETTDKLFSYD